MAKFWRFITGLVLVGATVGAGLGALVLGGAPAGAASLTITVNDASDGPAVPASCTTTPTEGDCTLRAAITAANTSGGDVTITLPDASMVLNNPSPSHFYSLLNANGTLMLNSGHIITIVGAGQTLAILQMQGASTTSPSSVLSVGSTTTADISGITAEGGVSAGSPGGAGILNGGTLNLSSSTVTGNSANTLTPTPPPTPPPPPTPGTGGGVYVEGGSVATLTNDEIIGNTSTGDGGGILNDGTLNLSSSTAGV